MFKITVDDSPTAVPVSVTPPTAVHLVDAVNDETFVDDIRLHLATRGAVLMRGFRTATKFEFADAVSVLGGPLLDYAGGNSPRTKLHEHVYTATSYPAEYDISLHNEMSYACRWPSLIAFYCAKAPARGGQTPIADCRTVLGFVPADVRDRFEENRVRYVQNLHGSRGPGRSWQQTFETTEREDVQRILAASDVSYSWHANGDLFIAQIRPATACHPESGDRVWYNQAEQWHPSSLGAAAEQVVRRTFPPDRLPQDANYGDGTAIAVDDLVRIRSAFVRARRQFDWHDDDVLVLDNMLMAHGRRPFEGQRTVLVAMAGLRGAPLP